MNAFRFPLEKALEWRRSQLELEESRFRQELAALAELDRRRAELEAAGIKAELQVREWNPVTGGDLAALGHYRIQVRTWEAELEARRAERLAQVAARQDALMEARRRYRLLERLRERRLEEWREAANRELDELANESFLAGWSRAAARKRGSRFSGGDADRRQETRLL